MTNTLLIGTTNSHKILEIKDLLPDTQFAFKTLRDYPAITPPEETGETFSENARLKAFYYSRITGSIVVAEDSGLEIDALDRAPGIFSSRFNSSSSYPEKFRVIYEQLKQRNTKIKTARFVCALTVANGNRIVFETQHTIEGEIAQEPKGSNGFGYDPIFFYPPLNRTLAELPTEDKAKISHRGKALRALRLFLSETQKHI